jgi:hypothetical protein
MAYRYFDIANHELAFAKQEFVIEVRQQLHLNEVDITFSETETEAADEMVV